MTVAAEGRLLLPMDGRVQIVDAASGAIVGSHRRRRRPVRSLPARRQARRGSCRRKVQLVDPTTSEVTETISGLASVDELALTDGDLSALDRRQTSLTEIDLGDSSLGMALRAGEGATQLVTDEHERILVTDTAGDELLVFTTDPADDAPALPRPARPLRARVRHRTDLVWVTLTGNNKVVGYDLPPACPWRRTVSTPSVSRTRSRSTPRRARSSSGRPPATACSGSARGLIDNHQSSFPASCLEEIVYYLLLRLMFRVPPETHPPSRVRGDAARHALRADPRAGREGASRRRSRAAHHGVRRRLPGPVGLAAGFDKDATGVDTWGPLGFASPRSAPSPRRRSPETRPATVPAARRPGPGQPDGLNNHGAGNAANHLRHRRGDVPIGANIGKTKIVPAEDAPGDYTASARLLGPLADSSSSTSVPPTRRACGICRPSSRCRPLLQAVLDTVHIRCS